MAQIAVMERAGLQYKQWLTGRDEPVCPLCGSLDGKVVPVGEEFAPGVFSPPAHPNCRCTVLSASGLEPIVKYPGQPRDERGRFAPGKMFRLVSAGKDATDAQRRTLRVLNQLDEDREARPKLQRALNEASSFGMPQKVAYQHKKHWSEVGAKTAEEYAQSARSTVERAERIFVFADKHGRIQFAFARNVNKTQLKVNGRRAYRHTLRRVYVQVQKF